MDEEANLEEAGAWVGCRPSAGHAHFSWFFFSAFFFLFFPFVCASCLSVAITTYYFYTRTMNATGYGNKGVHAGCRHTCSTQRISSYQRGLGAHARPIMCHIVGKTF